MKWCNKYGYLLCGFSLVFISCNNENPSQYKDLVTGLNLKTGEMVSCGPGQGQVGDVSFSASIPEILRTDFNTGVALLHSFEYDEAEKKFAKIIKKAPLAAMAYWGVAMCNFHPLWAPPTPPELEKGAKAVTIAQSIEKKTKRESDYIEAIAAFYKDHEELDHRKRVLTFEKAMKNIYLKYQDDKEALIFYALALNAAADPTDKTYSRQKKAFALLNKLFTKEPLHPGIAHYIIHNYDYPDLAEMALPAARKYASIAPASAHAQHMPSHIFTRLGLWDEGISSNLVSAASAKCYAEAANIKGHWDEELHAMDYLMYAYLQKGDDDLAENQLAYLKTIKDVYPLNFKVFYVFAAMPARYYLEKRMWKEASVMELYQPKLAWEKYSWQKAIFHFSRLLGMAHVGKTEEAKKELQVLKSLQSVLGTEKNKLREAHQVAVQVSTSEAWIQLKEGNTKEALRLMNAAANMEDATEKHPVTPGEVLPARELLADMHVEMNEPAMALEAYKAVLKTHPNRYNALYNAGLAAKQSGNNKEAAYYFKTLLGNVSPNCKRAGLEEVRKSVRSNDLASEQLDKLAN